MFSPTDEVYVWLVADDLVLDHDLVYEFTFFVSLVDEGVVGHSFDDSIFLFGIDAAEFCLTLAGLLSSYV